jgi:starch synthase
MAQRFRVAMLSAEAVPFAKVGGLADVVGALSRSLADLGVSVSVFLPRYESLALPAESDLEAVAKVDVPVAGEDRVALIQRLRHPGDPPHLQHYFIDQPAYFGRPGIYEDPDTGEPFPDNAERFVFFSRAALEAMRATAFVPDVIHANDHQTALVPAYLKTLFAEDAFFQMTATVLALHNLGYQGEHAPETMRIAGFPESYFYPLSPFEFWGKMNFLKSGIHFADRLVTVSERYAEEIQSGEEFGFGLQGVLNARRADLSGILNGIDAKIWNPRTDRHLPARYGAESLDGKAVCRRALLEEVGLPARPDWPVFGIISRLVEQKGLDLVTQAAPELFALPARWVILGSGRPRYEEALRDPRASRRRMPRRVQRPLGAPHRAEAIL